MFRPAVRELIAGAGAAKQFRGLDVGSVLHLRNADWTVTGSIHEQRRRPRVANCSPTSTPSAPPSSARGYSSAVGLLDGRGRISTVQGRAHHRSAAQGRRAARARLLRGAVQAVDAVDQRRRQHRSPSSWRSGRCSARSTACTAAVDARGLEIATLRAIGFGALPVLLSVMIEALALSIIGGRHRARALAWLVLQRPQRRRRSAARSPRSCSS